MRPELLLVTRPAERRRYRHRQGLLALAAVLGLVATACQAGWAQPYAGNGTSGADGAGGDTTLAVGTSLYAAGAMAPLPGGGFYVEDTSHCAIHKVDAAGTATIVAGNGSCGTTGDNGPATDATIRFFTTNSMAVDGSGRLWFTNASNTFGSYLRMVDTNGTITSPNVGATGDTGEVAAAPDGTLYYADVSISSGSTVIRHIDASGTGSAVGTVPYMVLSIAVPTSDELALGDGSDGTLHRYDLTTQASTATGVAMAVSPPPAATADGSLLIVSSDAHHVERVAPDNTVTVVAGNGASDPGTVQSGSSTDLAISPTALATASDGTLLVSSGHVVYRIDFAVGTSSYTGPATSASLQTPSAVVAIPGGGFYLADSAACLIRKVDATGTISTVAGTGTCGDTGDGGPATEAEVDFSHPSLALDGAGNLWFLEGDLRRVDVDGTISRPAVAGQVSPGGLTAGPDGTVYFLNDPAADPALGAIASDGQVTTVAHLAAPSGVTLVGLTYVSAGRFAVSSSSPAGAVYRVDAGTGVVTPTGATTPTGVTALAASPDGTIYAATADGVHVQRIAPDDTVTVIAGNGTADPGTTAQIGLATGLALSPRGLATTPNRGLLISSGHVVYRLDQPDSAG